MNNKLLTMLQFVTIITSVLCAFILGWSLKEEQQNNNKQQVSPVPDNLYRIEGNTDSTKLYLTDSSHRPIDSIVFKPVPKHYPKKSNKIEWHNHGEYWPGIVVPLTQAQFDSIMGHAKLFDADSALRSNGFRYDSLQFKYIPIKPIMDSL